MHHFFLLDEATSSLDTESESKIQIALDKLMIGKTVLIIAHRLSTVKNSDQIIVMNNGLVVDKGSHSKLIKTSILYKHSTKSTEVKLMIFKKFLRLHLIQSFLSWIISVYIKICYL